LADKALMLTTALQEVAEMVPGARLKGRGLMQGVDVGDGDLAADICARAYDKGLIIETSGNRDQVVKVLAPLTTTEQSFHKGFNILIGATYAAMAERNTAESHPILAAE
jgi:diaminobutyrate-2-oxoglutarate transaminase